jgi:uncharacterized protein (TIGR03083 family)
MATRLLRQYYEPVATVIPDEVGAAGPWVRHRHRMRDSLRALPDAEWDAATRCTDWTVKDVVSHLVTVDAYWMFAFNAARTDDPPTKFLEHFDPSSGTDVQVAALRAVPSAAVSEQFVNGTDALVQLVAGFPPEDWDAIGESPLGHLPARLLFGHAFWDSWLHERDMFVPLGRAPSAEPDELLAVTCFCLLFAGLQGGLVDDARATGDALSEPVEATLRFDELPDVGVRVVYDTGVRVELVDPGGASDAGSAIALVEGFTGRQPLAAASGRLPADFAAHLARAANVL